MEVEEGPGQLAVHVLGEARAVLHEVLAQPLMLRLAHPADPAVLERGQGDQEEQEDGGDSLRRNAGALPGRHGSLSIPAAAGRAGKSFTFLTRERTKDQKDIKDRKDIRKVL